MVVIQNYIKEIIERIPAGDGSASAELKRIEIIRDLRKWQLKLEKMLADIDFVVPAEEKINIQNIIGDNNIQENEQ